MKLKITGSTFGSDAVAPEPTVVTGMKISRRRSMASARKNLLDIDHSIKDGSFICGSPETVARQIREIALQAGADTFLGEFAFGALEHRQVMSSLRLFTDEVMPELKKFEVDALNYPKTEAQPLG